MPLYTYANEDGSIRVEEYFFSHTERPETIKWEGKTLHHKPFLTTPAIPAGSTCWPMCSDAAGVNPDHRQEAMDHSRKIGIPTEFNQNGQAVFTDRKHRKDYCEAIGLFDRSGGYGDPQPKNC